MAKRETASSQPKLSPPKAALRALEVIKPFARGAQLKGNSTQWMIALTPAVATRLAKLLQDAAVADTYWETRLSKANDSLKEFRDRVEGIASERDEAIGRARNLETILRNHNIEVPVDPVEAPTRNDGWQRELPGSFGTGKRR